MLYKLESLKHELLYEMSSTQKTPQEQTSINIKQIQNMTFPIGSVCATYSSDATIVTPTYPGSWTQCGTITGSPTGQIMFWIRTA